LPLAETPDNHSIRGLTDPDPTGYATYKDNSTIQGFKSNRLNAFHPLFLRHQTRRKYVQGCTKLLQFTHTQCRSIQSDRIKTKGLHLPHRRRTLLGHMFTHQQRVLNQVAISTQRPTKDRHRPPYALWLQRLQPAAQKNASDGPVCLGRTISLIFPSQERRLLDRRSRKRCPVGAGHDETTNRA